MSKEFLNKVRAAIDSDKSPESEKSTDNIQKEGLIENIKPAPEKSEKVASPKVKSKEKDAEPRLQNQSLMGFEDLQNILKEEKKGFSFNRRLVYIDDNIGEALDLLRKKAKINSNVLTSYLLKQFLLQNKELIKNLKGKKEDNIFFD